MSWDAIVVGAGPAGSTAARALALGGAKVLLLDRRMFPRDKPCGGGVSARILPVLPGPLPPRVPFTPINGTDWRWRGSWEIGMETPGAGCVVRRADFDAWLLDEAVRAGVEFRPGAPPEALECPAEGIRLQVRGRWESARRLIGCDGAVSWTARRLGIRPKALAWAMDAVVPDAVTPRPLLDFSFGKLGYAWVFPRPGGASVGICSVRRHDLRPTLERFLATLGQDPPPAPARLWPAPLGMSAVDGWGGRVLLAGDAAGAVHPALGEGIRFAVLTALKAAESVLDGTDYAAWFARELAPEFRAAAQLKALFYALPTILRKRLMTHPRVRRALMNMLSGDQTCRNSVKALKRLPALLLSRST